MANFATVGWGTPAISHTHAYVPLHCRPVGEPWFPKNVSNDILTPNPQVL